MSDLKIAEQFPLYISNSLSRKKEKFEALNPPFVGMYVCGPTVYNEAHLGNLRTFTSFDIVNRYLRFLGYKVRYVRNLTDVGHLTNDSDSGEDKLLKQAKLEQLEPMEVAQRYINSFHRVTHKFNLLDPDIEPQATGHIIEQIDMIQQIIDNGYAYEVNGSVYFDVNAYRKDYPYGELSGRNVDDLYEFTRELDGQSEKRNSVDFALWKKASPEHIMRWPSPWGDGFPGWHLECSAMSTKYLGETFDIHGGGLDLQFPHHECEIAQNVGSCGHKPVRYWMHGNMLTVNGQKMSKSLGNSFLPDELINGDHELLEKGYSPMTIRFFMLQSHYSSTIDFSNEALNAAEKGYKRLMEAWASLENLKFDGGFASEETPIDKALNATIDKLYLNMSDDFNTAKTLAELFELSSKINALKHGQIGIDKVQEVTFNRLKELFPAFIQDVLGLQREDVAEAGGSNNYLDGVMKLVIDIRQDARANKDWATSDKIRDQLKEVGITIKDGKEGSSYSID